MTQEYPERDPDQYRFRWTNHPDAYPDLTHCPSCGEPVEVPWADRDDRPADPVRCDQCERDLRLPMDAVKDQLCLVCKVPAAEADESVEYRRLETGERMCTNCVADLRAFKYELGTLTLVADWVTDEHREALITAEAQVADAFEQEYSFRPRANARYGRMEPDPDEDLTVEAVLEEADVTPEELREDLPEEVRDQLEEGDDGE